MFNADAYLESLEPPQVKLGGTLYKGRLLSIEEWAPFERRFSKMVETPDDQTLNDVLGVVEDYLRLAFASYARPAWQFWRPRNPFVDRFMHQPAAMITKTMESFLRSQALANGAGLGENEAPEGSPQQSSTKLRE